MFTKNFYRGFGASLNTGSTVTIPSLGVIAMNGNKFSYDTVAYSYHFIPCGATTNTYPSMSRLTTSTTLTSSNSGIIIGSGTTIPTLNDYNLENRITTPVSSSISLTRSVDDNDGVTLTAKCTITNAHTESITISEIGLFSHHKSSGDLSYGYLIDRTVLDTPVTIEAGGVGIVDYSIKFKYPTE